MIIFRIANCVSSLFSTTCNLKYGQAKVWLHSPLANSSNICCYNFLQFFSNHRRQISLLTSLLIPLPPGGMKTKTVIIACCSLKA